MIDPYEFNNANAEGDKEAVILPNLPTLVNKLSADETNGIKDKINEIAQVVNVIDPDNVTLQQATAGANKNLVDGIFQAGTGAGDGQTGVNVNQFGEFAGQNNTGDNQNASGADAGGNNTGENQNASGNGAGFGNTGDNQNAFGQIAGLNNKFNDVNLFGRETQADEDGQTVFRSAGGFMARISTLLLTATRKYIWPDKSGTIALLSDIGASNSKNLGATGLNQGGLLTINTNAAKFNLSAGFGYIVNGHSDPDTPTYIKVTWVAKIANTIPNLATQKQTYVAVDINGDLYFTNVPLTATQRRNFIRIGVLIHLNNSSVTYIDNQPTINIEIGGQVQDILEALGFRSLSGNRIFPVSNNLKIKKELGRVFKPGANFNNLTTQPHSFTLAAQEPISFRYRTQTGAEGFEGLDINPAIYDLNGTITPVAATATLATIQRVYIFQDGEIAIQPGQRVFASLNAAITALNSDVFITDLDIAENGLYLGAIVLTRNTVDLSNIAQAIFAPSIGTTANGSVAAPALAYTAEDVANKQNSLAVDGTGTKYPTVDAVNTRLSTLLPSPLLGNILRGNGTAYAGISEVEFMRNKEAFNRSALAAAYDWSKVFAWDNFIRPNNVNEIGVSDSGQNWIALGSFPKLGISENAVYGVNPTGIRAEVIDRTNLGSGGSNGQGSVLLEADIFRIGGTSLGLLIAKDELNYIFCNLVSGNLILNIVISGVLTQLTSTAVTGSTTSVAGNLKLALRSRSVNSVILNAVSGLQETSFTLSSSQAAVFSELNPRYVGIIKPDASLTQLAFLNNFKATNLFRI